MHIGRKTQGRTGDAVVMIKSFSLLTGAKEGVEKTLWRLARSLDIEHGIYGVTPQEKPQKPSSENVLRELETGADLLNLKERK